MLLPTLTKQKILQDNYSVSSSPPTVLDKTETDSEFPTDLSLQNTIKSELT